MRLFIAINFTNETIGQLLSLSDELRSRSDKGRFSEPMMMHLTLAFLGECDSRQSATIKEVMKSVQFEPFSINIERVGRFRRNGGDVWWAGVQSTSALQQLHKDLSEKLVDSGFVLDERKFSPHITLGREVVTDAAPWQIKPFGETVRSIELMKSERIAGKLTYTAIFKKRADDHN
ncbi:MAG: RNA 2',3'-cyclic phosphodiesterase [Oscillospiraceae bacterium]|nr:RNA 2',3'-cyclic phosphodiesterase [Oscillospiraceae bacterium]